ncbi:hypothetical protein PIGHUM_03195 [Pigmentiphaga humi]|uniref:Nucleotidyltransferase n=1 Tax=Pigmentiphaga humi TaxID=2478468 RepID=A0A3P4B491_9BURK|nr:nucleotidyltransferase family protein [Pigmentiphaga humi]VCU71114.1 hypothetical protein PIGHUM_03195 [Pigmentiphaga humi]
MISLFGVGDRDTQRALLELCFSAQLSARNLETLERAIQEDALTDGQNRMLPLISRRLPAGALSPFAESRVRGAYKHTLYRNHLLLDRAQKFRRALLDAGFGECVFLKGVAAALTNPHGLGARPMADIDVLLGGLQHRPQEALRFFAEQGMVKKGATLRSVTLLSPEKFEFDVHWYLHNWALRQSSVEKMAADARTIDHAKGRFSIPCAEHNLAHVLAHGLMTPSVNYDGRWAVDVLSILVQRPVLDAARFQSFVSEFSVPDAVRVALQTVAEQAPESIVFDRRAALALARGVRRGRPGSFWLYYRTPGAWDQPGQFMHRPIRHQLTAQLRSRVVEPAQVARHNGASFWASVGASIDFPPATLARVGAWTWQHTRRIVSLRRQHRTPQGKDV